MPDIRFELNNNGHPYFRIQIYFSGLDIDKSPSLVLTSQIRECFINFSDNHPGNIIIKCIQNKQNKKDKCKAYILIGKKKTYINNSPPDPFPLSQAIIYLRKIIVDYRDSKAKIERDISWEFSYVPKQNNKWGDPQVTVTFGEEPPPA